MSLTTYWLAARNLKQIKWVWETSDISSKSLPKQHFGIYWLRTLYKLQLYINHEDKESISVQTIPVLPKTLKRIDQKLNYKVPPGPVLFTLVRQERDGDWLFWERIGDGSRYFSLSSPQPVHRTRTGGCLKSSQKFDAIFPALDILNIFTCNPLDAFAPIKHLSKVLVFSPLAHLTLHSLG